MFARLSLAMALAMAGPAWGQQQEESKLHEVSKLRQELKELQQRMQSLEKRLQEAESAQRTPAPAQPQAASSDSAFNPAISLILQGTASRSSRDPANFQITGFAPTNGEVAPARRGFSLGESELIVSSNVDPYFRGQFVAALTPEGTADVEEAFFQTLALGHGLTLKAGRFLSGIGYQNEIHQHAWDFQDAPLPYKAFLGGRLNDDGVQLRWVAPTELLVELGTELGRGRTFPGSDAQKNGAGAWSAYGHVGGDVGESVAWRAGLSHLRASPRDRGFTDNDSLGNAVTQSFTGSSRLWIADFVVKWAPDGNSTSRNFKLQGELFRRTESGTIRYDDSAQAAPQFGAPFTGGFDSRQSGWYLQGAWQFMPRWRVGYRYDRLDFGTVGNGVIASGAGPTAADFPTLATPHDPSRNTLMLDWSPTEFSRVRLQIAADRSRVNGTDNQILLQYIQSLGAHGAHRF